jgi:PAS domain-containing protein
VSSRIYFLFTFRLNQDKYNFFPEVTKKQEDALLDKQAFSSLKFIMDGIPVGIVAIGDDARIIYTNPLASKLFGKQVTDEYGITCGAFIDCPNCHNMPEMCSQTESCPNCSLFRAISAVVSGGTNEEIQEGEVFLVRDRGFSNIWVKYKVSSFILENSKVAILTLENITDRKQTEEALRKSEEFLRALSSASFEAIFLSEKGICLGQNIAAQRLFGYSNQEAIGRMGTEWIAPRGSPKGSE